MQNRQPDSMPAVQVFVESGPHIGTTVAWRERGSYLIGRAAHAQLTLVHDLLTSLEHCRLDLDAQGCTVRDLGSRQGTLVNGNLVSQSQLRSGDVLVVGESRLRLTLSDALVATASMASEPRSLDLSITVDARRAPPATAVLDIPGYTITRKIGQGGMGVVYDACHRDTGQRVAIKTIIPTPGAAQKSIQLFQREMKHLRELNHPRIVRFIDSGEHAGQIFLAMEYVETVNLEAILKPLPREKQIAISCRIIGQVLEALAYAHDRKLVHRDVKPGNILITGTPPQFVAKLADFGLAKNFELAGLSKLTADSEMRGTPAFMPWEQLRNSRYAKPSVDIYAAGATLYYYLSGRPPGQNRPPRTRWLEMAWLFSRDTTAKKDSLISCATTDFSHIPDGLAHILRTALSAHAQERYSTATTMRTALLPFGC